MFSFRMLSVFFIFFLFLFSCSEEVNLKKKSKNDHLVETYLIKEEALAIKRERTGTLQAEQEVKIFNQEEGRIIALPFYEGDVVRKGDVVAKLDDRLLRSQLVRMQAIRLRAEKDLKRIRDLASKRMTAQTELTRLETELAIAKADEKILKTRLDYATIVSPINGIVSHRLSESGNVAERYKHLLTISNQSSLITQVSVSELLINKLEKGASVSVNIDALPLQEPITASIKRIHPNVDPLTRTAIVEIALSPKPLGARPGQLARVMLSSQASRRLLIPFSALRRSSEGEYVFIVDENTKAQKIPVRSGLRFNEKVEIIQGLEEEQKVITRGFTNLRHNKTVMLVPSVSDHTNLENNTTKVNSSGTTKP